MESAERSQSAGADPKSDSGCRAVRQAGRSGRYGKRAVSSRDTVDKGQFKGSGRSEVGCRPAFLYRTDQTGSRSSCKRRETAGLFVY